MKKIFTLIAVAAIAFACDAKPEKTIENLKAAATGESNASAKYAKFAEKATADSLFAVATLFNAASAAEAQHAANHIKVLKELSGEDFAPVIEEIIVGTTLENIATAKGGEEHEFTVMYPEFIATAQAEGATKAENSFTWATTAEAKHAGFYQEATDAINNNDLCCFTAEWAVCPVCGDTYKVSELGASCALCGTAKEKFVIFSTPVASI